MAIQGTKNSAGGGEPTASLRFVDIIRYAGVKLYLSGYLLDQLGDALWFVTLGWVAAQAPSPFWAGTIFAAGAIPAAVFTLVGGPLVDKIGSGKAVVITESVRLVAVLAWIAAMLVDATPLAVIPVLAFVIGTVDGLHQPALEVMPTDLLPEHGQTTAAGVEKVEQRIGQATAGAVGGFLLGHVGLAGPSIAAAAALVLAVAVFARVTSQHPTTAPQAQPNLIRSSAKGWGIVLHQAVLVRIVPFQGLYNGLTAGVSLMGYPLKARAQGWSSLQYGGAYAAWAGGLLAGSMLIVRLVNKLSHKLRAAMCLSIIVGGCIVGLGYVTDARLFMVLSAICGLCSGPVTPSLSGFVRSHAMTRPAQRGAILGVLTFVTTGLEPLGYLLIGGLAFLAGIQGAFILAGSLIVIAGVVVLASRAVCGLVSL